MEKQAGFHPVQRRLNGPNFCEEFDFTSRAQKGQDTAAKDQFDKLFGG
jgi:hypothetical protein